MGVSISATIPCPDREVGIWITNVEGDRDVEPNVAAGLSRLSGLFLTAFQLIRVEVVALVRMSPGIATLAPIPNSNVERVPYKARTCKSKDDSSCFKVLQFVVTDEKFSQFNP